MSRTWPGLGCSRSTLQLFYLVSFPFPRIGACGCFLIAPGEKGMLDVLERFELESADGGHGTLFPGSRPQLPTLGVSERLGPRRSWGRCCQLQGRAACSRAEQAETWRTALSPVCPHCQLTPHIPTHTGVAAGGILGPPGRGQPCGMYPEEETGWWAGFSHVHTGGPWECSAGASVTPA